MFIIALEALQLWALYTSTVDIDIDTNWTSVCV